MSVIMFLISALMMFISFVLFNNASSIMIQILAALIGCFGTVNMGIAFIINAIGKVK
jgi:hypothetical protein